MSSNLSALSLVLDRQLLALRFIQIISYAAPILFQPSAFQAKDINP
ncbi:hypothetical protein [Amphiplicatus metriothermophilus]|nr:hypothetical protein [Amphiplicatus metriothermophilus]MBB5519549.1 hypothetical protein [Amphiplicatus metriothermophilus]